MPATLIHGQGSDDEAKREQARVRVVRLVYVVLGLLIFEGSLRKWVAPEYSRYLFFIRDPFVLLIYVIALRHRFFCQPRAFMMVPLIIGLLMFPVVFEQSLESEALTRLLLAAYGWRQYFFYVPLAFVIGSVFRRSDLQRMTRYLALLMIPVAMLVMAQFAAAPDSVLNRGSADEAQYQFQSMGVTKDKIRPAGTFTSVVGQWHLVVSTGALLLGVWLLPKHRRYISPRLLIASTVALLVCLGFSNSRGMVVHFGLVLLSALVAGAVVRGASMKWRAWALPAALVIVALVLYPIVFPDAYHTFALRWTQAAAAEQHIEFGLFGRALAGLYNFAGYLGSTPIFGYGLGLGGNAAMIIGSRHSALNPVYAETDWARNIVDLGVIFGPIFIAYRVAFTVWLGSTVLRAARRFQDPLPVLLFGYVGVVLLYNQITGHGSVNGFGWLFVGFCMAATRFVGEPDEQEGNREEHQDDSGHEPARGTRILQPKRRLSGLEVGCDR